MNSNDGVVNEGFTNDNDGRNKRQRRQRRRDNPESGKDPEINEVNNPPKNAEDPVNQKKRRRRRSKQNDGINDVVDGQQNGGVGSLGLDVYLNDICDDVEIQDSSENHHNTLPPLRPNGTAGIQSGLGDSVFIEGTKKFRQVNHDKFIRNKLRDTQHAAEQNNPDRLSISNDYNNDLLQSSIGINENYHVFSTFLLGLLSGLMIMHVILIFTLINTTDSAFLIAYLPLQRPFYIMFYLIFIIVSISIWDRLNVGQEDRKWDSSQIAVLVALILLLIAFIIQNTLYLFDSSFYNLNINKTNQAFITSALSIVSIWRILNCVITALVTVSWLIISIIPTFNNFVLSSRYHLLLSSNSNNHQEHYNDFMAASNGNVKF